MSAMSVIARDFIKRFTYFKRQAITGSAVKLTDREGHRFVFKMERLLKLSRGAHAPRMCRLRPGQTEAKVPPPVAFTRDGARGRG